MVESAKDYADRVLAYCLKATKQILLNDPTLKPLSKTTESFEEPEPKPEVLKASFQEMYNSRFTKATAGEAATQDKIPTVTEYFDGLQREFEGRKPTTK